MPAWYTAIMMESGDVEWRPKLNAELADSGPDDHRLIIEFEGDLENIPWITNLSCGNATVDLDILAASVPTLFDKPWVRGQGRREASIAEMESHHMIELSLETS